MDMKERLKDVKYQKSVDLELRMMQHKARDTKVVSVSRKEGLTRG